MTTLENLYYGNIAPHEYEVVRGSEYDITAKLVIRHEQELSATLTEQQNTILQKIKDNHTELMNLGERDAFRRGFSLAVRLMVDAMSNEKTWRALFRSVSRERNGGSSYPTSPNKAHTADLSRFVGEKNAVRLNTGRWTRFVTTFWKRFLVVTRFYGLFKKFDIDIVEGKNVGWRV